jgi:hypothetical protein
MGWIRRPLWIRVATNVNQFSRCGNPLILDTLSHSYLYQISDPNYKLVAKKAREDFSDLV